MNEINIKFVTDDALLYIKKNIKIFTDKLSQNDNNDWIKNTIPGNIYVEKKYKINDFSIAVNPKSVDRELDYNNAIVLYENLRHLPRYILTDVRFWLWLMMDKFYAETKSFMEIKGISTINDHWLDKQKGRRTLFFGVLSRLYFRVDRTAQNGDYSLTKWVFDNPERFRNLSWRTYSDNKDIVIGCLNGCKKAVEDTGIENNKFYPIIAKQVGFLGSANLLDAYSVEELSTIVYNEYLKIVEEYNDNEGNVQH